MTEGFKAVITSDLHLRSIDNYGKLLADGTNSRLQDRIHSLELSVQYAIDHDADYWICLGDVFDKINPGEKLRDIFVQIITPLIKADIPIIILIGNHDTDFKIHSFMTEANLLNTLNSSAIRIINNPIAATLKGVECLFLPFGKDEDIALELQTHENKIVFGHFGVDGALVSGTEIVLSIGLSQKLFNKHRFTFLGHYHKSQTAKKWMYVGSIAKVDFGERNDKKGFVYLEADKNSLKHKFIDVKDRVFFQHEVNQEDDPDFDTLNTWKNLKGKVVRLIFVGEEDWYLKFNFGEIRSKIMSTGGASKFMHEHKTIYDHRLRVPEIDASSSWHNGIEVYVKKTKRPEMEALGKKILEEVL